MIYWKFLERHDSTGLGGFNRGQKFFSEDPVIKQASKAVKDSKEATEALENGLKELEKNAQVKALFEKKENKDIDLKTTEGLQKLKEALGKSDDKDFSKLIDLIDKKLDADIKVTKINVSALRDRVLERLGQLNFAARKSVFDFGNDPTKNKERILNLSQQISLGAWIFNDIIPGFDKGGNNPLNGMLDAETKEGKLLSGIKALNTKARNTPMFSEVKWDELEGFANLPKDLQKELKNFVKIGLRGRSGYGEKHFKVETQPLYNLKADYDQNGKEKKEGIIKGDIPALKAGSVSMPTARRDALPQELVTILTNNKNKPGCQTIIDELVGKGVLIKNSIEKEVNGKLELLESLESAPSYAAIIDKAGFPTYCSVSGTTGELVSTLVYMLDTPAKEELNDTLNTLLELAKGTEFKEVTKNDFSTFFVPIATFMEVGHFHTTAEVLGGFYSVAVAKSGQGITAENMKEGFETLLGILKEHPEAFLGAVEKK